MTAFAIFEVEVLDEALVDRYRLLARAAWRRYVVRGGLPQAVEGAWPPGQCLVIVEFPTMRLVLKRGEGRGFEFA